MSDLDKDKGGLNRALQMAIMTFALQLSVSTVGLVGAYEVGNKADHGAGLVGG
jgi:hypothetical protein